ncbi:hypothetical protein HPB51_015511 [Rhipicephalus microplus]|uniref:PiggyBac transposable element-derived protein domain-containing protein n=1 Tax=Rhipicephalus microplus TaxID=6941 RepID=A0A9J6DGP1_RHIMP|nr:hypothetical protein HPB51_015511 [Rhipicephalus microplus]
MSRSEVYIAGRGSDMDSSNDERVEAEPSSKGPIDKYVDDSSDEDLEVEESSTVKNKRKKIWHWVKKDVPLNEGFPESELVPLVTPKEAKTPLHMFSRLVDEELLEHLTFETNRLRVQNNKTKVKPVRIDEIRKFLEVVLYMSVVCLPFRRMYWSRQLRQAHVADCMPRNRFDEIISLFHAANNDNMKKKGEDGYDRLYRVRLVLEVLNKNVLGAAEMETCLAVDEMIIPFKGHAAQLLLSMTTPRSPAAVELTGEPCNEEEEEQQHHQQQQQLQPQLPPAARQRVPVTASRGIRGLQSMGLQLLAMRQTHEFEIRRRQLAIENRKLDIEERQLALEERRQVLDEKKHELEMTSRQQEHVDFVKHVEQMFVKLSQEVTDLTRRMSGSS